jgi:carboxyl-terminal processing protease
MTKRKLAIVALIAIFFVGVGFQKDFFEIAKQLEIFTNTFKTVNMNYVDDTNPGELMDKTIKGMLKELDPYTVFFNEQDVIKFRINNTGEYTGIGAMIGRKDGNIILREIFKDYAADKAGLKAGDIITQVEDIVLKDYKEDVSNLLKGGKDKKIDIKFLRQGKAQTAQISLNEVDIKAVPYFQLIGKDVGYIVLQTFSTKTTQETKAAILDLKAQGATKLILDLRSNPGGLLTEAVNICNLFVPKNEVIVTTKSKIERHNSTYKTRFDPLDLEIPLTILINERSASASEIVAGGLQDLDRAVVIGNKSFGKGLVQRPVDLPYGTQVKITISRYYTPSGRCIQALDYTKKDASGKAQKTESRQEFLTKAGRKVFDGGGIEPDIAIDEAKMSALAKALNANDAIFNFSTKLYYDNQKAESYQVTDKDFLSFKDFIKSTDYKIETAAEKQLLKFMEVAKEENIDEYVNKDYETLLANIKNNTQAQLEKNKNEIKKLINEELIKRYKYKDGFFAYQVENQIEIKKCIEVLNNPALIKKTLSK